MLAYSIDSYFLIRLSDHSQNQLKKSENLFSLVIELTELTNPIVKILS